MAWESYPNLAHNSRAVSLAEYEQLAAPLGLSGLVGYTGTTPVFADSTGRQVKIRSGVQALVRGMAFRATSETIIDNTKIVANSSGNPRIDLLVLRMDRAASSPNAFAVNPVVITGTPAASPVAPSPTRTITTDASGVYDIPLAEIKVANGATTIAAGDVTNRAWWISGSGYVGFSGVARPPAEAGVVFHETDTDIHWIGTDSGSYRRLASSTGWVDVSPPGGWSGLLSFCRDGGLVVMAARVTRTGASLSPTTITMITIGVGYRPSRTVHGVYVGSFPDIASDVSIGADGLVQFVGTSEGGVNTGSVLTSNMVWPAATA